MTLESKERTVPAAAAPATPVVVLHSFSPDPSPSSFQSQILDGGGGTVRNLSFTWWRGLTADYDVLHLHWPEFMLRGRRRIDVIRNYVLMGVLLLRLRLTGRPLVRTLHNVRPHETGSRTERLVLGLMDRMTACFVRLNPLTPAPPGRPVVTAPHPNYVDAYAAHPRVATVPGRLLHAGQLRPYKGVEELITAFRALPDPALSLHVLGRVIDPELEATIRAGEREDPRITAQLGFADDAAMVASLASAQLVVLPYRTMHNSGVLLAALSVGTPVLVPDTDVNRWLRAEFGAPWVHLFDPPLRADHLTAALPEAATVAGTGMPPKLAERSWSAFRAEHEALYRQVLLRPGRDR